MCNIANSPICTADIQTNWCEVTEYVANGSQRYRSQPFTLPVARKQARDTYDKCVFWENHGPPAKLPVAHVPGMLRTLSPHHGLAIWTYITARVRHTNRDACRIASLTSICFAFCYNAFIKKTAVGSDWHLIYCSQCVKTDLSSMHIICRVLFIDLSTSSLSFTTV